MLAEILLCESDGRVLGGMQFQVLVEVLFCENDGRVLGDRQFGGCWWRCCFAWPRARGYAVWGLVEVLFCDSDDGGAA